MIMWTDVDIGSRRSNKLRYSLKLSDIVFNWRGDVVVKREDQNSDHV